MARVAPLCSIFDVGSRFSGVHCIIMLYNYAL